MVCSPSIMSVMIDFLIFVNYYTPTLVTFVWRGRESVVSKWCTFSVVNQIHTDPNGAVAMLLVNGLIATGFASQYQALSRFLMAQWVGVRPLHPLLSH